MPSPWARALLRDDDRPPCDCGPEDGDYGSGYHFRSCPRYAEPVRSPATRRAMAGQLPVKVLR